MPQWWCTHRVWPPAWFKQQSSLHVGVRSLSAILWPIHPVTTGHWSLPNLSGLPPHLCLEWENQWCMSAVRHACVPCSLNTAQNKFELIQCSVTVLITRNFIWIRARCLSLFWTIFIPATWFAVQWQVYRDTARLCTSVLFSFVFVTNTKTKKLNALSNTVKSVFASALLCLAWPVEYGG